MTDRSTIYAVAKRAGVSIATVSRVMRDSATVSPRTKDRVLAAAADLRYVPSAAASQLASSREGTLGLVLPHIDGPYYSELIVGFEQEAGQQDHSVALVLANPRADATRAVRGLAERVSGIAFMARSSAGDDLIAELAGPRQVVTVARASVPGVPSLRVENQISACELTEHLLDTGRESLCFLGTPEPGSDLEERVAGFHEAHRRRGRTPVAVVDCALDEAAGRAAFRYALERWPRVDGFVCGNDLVALAVLSELRGRGIEVPGECAVTGWDDILAARHVTPGLTTVQQPVHRLGAEAARILMTPHQHPGTVEHASTVVYRSSCCTDPHPEQPPPAPD